MNFKAVANKLLENRFGGGFVVEKKILRITAYYGKTKRTWEITLGKVGL